MKGYWLSFKSRSKNFVVKWGGEIVIMNVQEKKSTFTYEINEVSVWSCRANQNCVRCSIIHRPLQMTKLSTAIMPNNPESTENQPQTHTLVLSTFILFSSAWTLFSWNVNTLANKSFPMRDFTKESTITNVVFTHLYVKKPPSF